MAGSSENSEGNGAAPAWRFLIDENLSPTIVTELDRQDIAAEYVLDALFEGADDFEDILPYCRETETVLVTNNVHDFNPTTLSPDDHAGIVIVHDKVRPASEIATELRRIVAAYPSRDAFTGSRALTTGPQTQSEGKQRMVPSTEDDGAARSPDPELDVRDLVRRYLQSKAKGQDAESGTSRAGAQAAILTPATALPTG